MKANMTMEDINKAIGSYEEVLLRRTKLTPEMIEETKRNEMRAYLTIGAIKSAIKMYEGYVSTFSKKVEVADKKCRTEQEYYKAVSVGNVELANEIYKEREEVEKWFDVFNESNYYLNILYVELERRTKLFNGIKSVAACLVAAVVPNFN